jgi:hypothetical protein
MQAAERAFPPRNDYGVFAFGIARTSRRGLPGPLGLVVHVERKLRSPPARVPALRVAGRTVVADVVGTGRGPRASHGSMPAFTGLHPGAVIVCGNKRPEIGAVGCLLAFDQAPALLVTAGHLFPRDATGMRVFSAPAGWDDAPAPIGTLRRNLLDGDQPIDAALVVLNGDGIKLARRTKTRWTLGPVVDLDDIDGLSSQAYRWRSGQFTEARPASTLPQTVHFRGDLRDFTVRGVVSSSPSTTADGDSGTVLVESSGRRRAIGVCVGEFDRESIFEPLDKVLSAFGDQVAGARIWPNPT